MSSVHDILDAIRGLPRPERLQLVEQLTFELGSEPRRQGPKEPPPNSKLEVRNGFYVYTGPVGDISTLDHRLVREERIDSLARRSSARSD
jgi:hypothetical protein